MAVIGSGDLRRQDPRWTLAHELGFALINARYRLVCGGRGGVMQAASEGARSSPAHVDGDVLGILPGTDRSRANPAVDIALPTGLGNLRNGLVSLSDAVVAIGGGAGTLSELALAWVHGRVVLAYRVDGWSGKLADTALDQRRPDRVVGVRTAEEVLEALSARWDP